MIPYSHYVRHPFLLCETYCGIVVPQYKNEFGALRGTDVSELSELSEFIELSGGKKLLPLVSIPTPCPTIN